MIEGNVELFLWSAIFNITRTKTVSTKLQIAFCFCFVLFTVGQTVFTVWKTTDTMQCRYTCNHGPRNKVLVLFHFYKIQTLLCFRQQSKTEEDVYAKVLSHSTWLNGLFCLCQNTGRKRRTERRQSGRGLANQVGRSKIYWHLLDTSLR